MLSYIGEEKEGATRAILSGGEPTIHPQIIQIIKEAKEMGYRHVQLISNGRMFSYEKFVKEVKEAGLDEVTFSLHSHLKEPFEKITQIEGSYLQSMRGLLNVKKYQLIVSIDIVINKINYKTLKETICFFVKLGVQEFDLLYLVPCGSAWLNWTDLSLDPHKARKYLDKVFALSKRSDLFIWTNRLPAIFLEGYEHLIQSPAKLHDEIRGREQEFKNFIKGDVVMGCFGERCQYCFINNFCQDLMELKSKKMLKSKPSPFCIQDIPAKKEIYRFDKNFDLYEFLEFFKRARYYVKSSRCQECLHNKLCQGAHIDEIRSRGFKILVPAKPLFQQEDDTQAPLGGHKSRDDTFTFYSFNDSCDFQCVFCEKRSPSSQKVSQIESDFIKYRTKGVKKIELGGTEPLNHPHIIDIMTMAGKYFAQIWLQTASYKLADSQFVDKIFVKQIVGIQIPLYGASAKTHDRIVGKPGTFDLVLKILDNLKARKVKVHISTILLKENVDEVPSLFKLLSTQYEGCQLQLNALRPTRSSLETYENLVPTFKSVKASIEKTNLCRTSDFQGHGVSLVISNVPLCMIIKTKKELTRIGRGLSCYFTLNQEIEWNDSSRRCKECCLYKLECPGLPQEYFKLYGDGEVAPIKQGR